MSFGFWDSPRRPKSPGRLSRETSIFSQLLQIRFPRLEFQQAVKTHQADRGGKGFTSWGLFVAMLLCQLGRAHTRLEDLRRASCEGRMKRPRRLWRGRRNTPEKGHVITDESGSSSVRVGAVDPSSATARASLKISDRP
ncbi:MAG: hypothetical protein DMG13_30055 [Acidobacteria bacterium]|nr:MAG: hypothetical protein DMG13_30055 [Acidobacteriota bacterium]